MNVFPSVRQEIDCRMPSDSRWATKNFLLKSLGSLFPKAAFEVSEKIKESGFCAANFAPRVVW
jgi:hypothetical protein